jgi:hypothetical protein
MGSPLFRVREKQKGTKNFRTEDLKGLKELTLAISPFPIAIRFEVRPQAMRAAQYSDPIRIDRSHRIQRLRL